MPRFRIERKGDLVLSTMRQRGWPGIRSVTDEKLSRGECTEYEMKWINEIHHVQTCVWGADAEGWHDPLLPPFNVRTAFYFRGGVYAAGMWEESHASYPERSVTMLVRGYFRTSERFREEPSVAAEVSRGHSKSTLNREPVPCRNDLVSTKGRTV